MRQHFEMEERHWWFVARRGILLNLLDRSLPKNARLDILDAGCGGGATMEALSRYGRVRGMELSAEAVDFNRSRGRDVVEGAIEKIPFPDASFDLALALDVLEHVSDDLLALRDLHRVLRPGGSLLVTVPALQALWSPHDIANGHYRRYTLDELRGRIEQAGFEVVVATYFNTILFPVILAVRTLGRLRPGHENGASDVGEVPGPLNFLLERTFSLEARLIGRRALPVGVSALCLVRKPSS